MKNGNQELSQEQLDRIRSFTLMHDEFMSAVFENNTEAATLVIRIILERNDIEVVKISTQKVMSNIYGHSVRLDMLAVDSGNRLYNIEIQRQDKGPGYRRARYYSSLIDAHVLEAGADYSKLADTYVIFITEKDYLGRGKPIYHIDRTVKETGLDFSDGTHIIYVNGTIIDESTSLGRLMHDFHCTDSADMHYEQLAERTRDLKETEGGRAHMSIIVEEYGNERYAEGLAEGINTTAVNMLKRNYSVEVVSECTGLSTEQVQELAAKIKENSDNCKTA